MTIHGMKRLVETITNSADLFVNELILLLFLPPFLYALQEGFCLADPPLHSLDFVFEIILMLENFSAVLALQGFLFVGHVKLLILC